MRNSLFLLILLIFIGDKLYSQQPAYKNFNVEQGLPTNNVYCAFKDSRGFMWFGTNIGVSRYDGYKFKNFTLENGLTDSDVFAIYEDNTGRIWFSTNNGKLCYFENGIFKNSKNDLALLNHDFTSSITSIIEDDQGNVWFSSKRGGVKFLDISNVFHDINSAELERNRFGQVRIYGLCKNQQGDILAWTDRAIENLTDHTTISYNQINFQIGFQNSVHVRAVTLPNGNLLLTENGNFYEVDLENNKLESKRKVKLLNESAVFIDIEESGVVWIGTMKGAYELDNIDAVARSIPFLQRNSVTDRFKDNEGNTWFTTLQNGIYFLPLSKVTNYTDRSGLPEKEVNAISGNNAGDICIGQGSYFSIIKDGQVTSFSEDPLLRTMGVEHSYEQSINAVFIDDEGQCLVASNLGVVIKSKGKTYYRRGTSHAIVSGANNTYWFTSPSWLIHSDTSDLALYMSLAGRYANSKSDTLRFSTKTEYFMDKKVHHLHRDPKNNVLWIGLADGLLKLEKGRFSDYSGQHEGLRSKITDIIGAGDGSVWIATYGYGVFKLNENGSMLQHISVKHGLSTNLCKALAYDNEGILWIGTDNGLDKVKLIGNNNIITHYSDIDGLLANKVNDLHYYKSTLWVATDKGLSVMPTISDSISSKMPIYITGVEINNKRIDINDMPTTLGYSENSVSINFVAINYLMDGNIEYRYRLNNKQDWSYTTNTRIDFSSLTHGKYAFELQAKNKNGQWIVHTAPVAFVIHAPLWKTWWAYAVYFIMALSIVYAVFNYEFKRRLLKSELLLQTREATKFKDLEQLKSQFFSNISHEFRTPLALILGPTEQLISKHPDKETQNKLSIIKRNANGLLSMINQLLDLSKLEAGRLTLHKENKEIINDLRLITEPFKFLANKKGITFRSFFPNEKLLASYDPKKLEIIVNNLLSNAIKFTPRNGSVELHVDKHSAKEAIVIKVSDTGIGIEEKHISQIFERFYQVDSSDVRKHQGTGIGLALTKELVELHNGTIKIQSKKGEGTEFTLEIPLISQNVANEIIPVPLIDEKSRFNAIGEEIEKRSDNSQQHKQNAPLILIVEDNNDMRSHIAGIVRREYRIITAENGKSGLELALKNTPELIITDVMMPEMSGTELCYEVKTDMRTSHIPLIMLTAKASLDSKIIGIETGADSYLSKPFHEKELLVIIKNLIHQRRKLRERFTNEPNLAPNEVAVNSVDELFLKRAIQIIEDNMHLVEFDVTMFTREIGMSRSLLHQKLKALTNQSASEFTRTIRLKRAAQLLKQTTDTIAEISLQVGFNDANYFARCFKDLFGTSPSDYRANK